MPHADTGSAINALGPSWLRTLDSAYCGLVIKRPALVLLVIALLAVLSAWSATRVRIDVSADSLLLEHDRDLDYYRAVSARYGSDDFLIVAFSPAEDLFASATIEMMQRLRDELASLPRVDSVVSILDVPLLASPATTLEQLEQGWRTLQSPDTDLALARLELRDSPLYSKRLVSPDARTTALQVNFRPDTTLAKLRTRRDQLRERRLESALSGAERQQLEQVTLAYDTRKAILTSQEKADITAIRAILERFSDGARMYLGGVPMITVDMMTFIRHDLVVFGIAVLAILSALLLAFFRALRWVVLPLLTAAVATVMTLGAVAAFDWPLTVVSSNFVALLLIFSLSMCVHLIVRYRELQTLEPHRSQAELVVATVRSKIPPSFYTAATSMIAFISLGVSGIRPVVDFGWIMVVGLAIAFALVFTLFPAALVLLAPGRTSTSRDITGAITKRLAALATRYSYSILFASAALLALSAVAISRLGVENRFIDYFDDSTEIYQGMEVIDRELGGTTPLDVIVDAPALSAVASADDELDELLDADEGGITATSYWFNSAHLDEVARAHRYLESLPQSGKVLSLDTVMQTLTPLVPGNGDVDDLALSLLYKRLPRDIHVQLIAPYLSADGNQLRFAVRVFESDPSLQRDALLENLRGELPALLGVAPEQVHLTGMLVLYNNLLQSLFRSQLLTVVIVFATILVMFTLFFRSLRVALVAMVPNLMAAGIVLGLLGAFGIPLDIMTITIAAITIGIAVDDTIHYVHRYRDEWRRDQDYVAAIYRAHATIGRAMYYTTAAITVGFAVLVLSNFTPTIYFGLFTALAMLAALVADLVLLPVLMWRLRVYS